ncbi:calmodulin-binding transcription activator 1 [Biomphalaria pfeifferi]|uniref:Calmodulin-binding transcription activator 1 n=1 Tax=Biomphalaria pfeifferi TaxID=112525 RepID=A0AAD8EZY6_BIOPF|nr:calmodulin-binding transcription activator 1 [Biomphalaria pfeifferi]
MTINDTLFVAPFDCSRNVPEHQDRINTCSVKFNKPNATISDTGFYKCCNKMSPNVPALSVVKLYVVNQVETSHNYSLVQTSHESIILEKQT